jgi:hypothetical protein
MRTALRSVEVLLWRKKNTPRQTYPLTWREICRVVL